VKFTFIAKHRVPKRNRLAAAPAPGELPIIPTDERAAEVRAIKVG
jgi:hypothetical protein